MEVNETLVKSGENMISVRLRRGPTGIRIHAKANPIFERYFESHAGTASPVSDFHREWRVDKGASSLKVWDTTLHAGVQRGSGASYRVDVPGYMLVMDSECVNMSFLRLVGISSPEGITFEVKGAFTRKYVQNLGQMIMQAGKALYQDFLKPVDVTISVNIQEN